MTQPVPAYGFKPEMDRSYLVFCPDHGGWHVGEWWTLDGPGRWVLALDISIDLEVSHVMEAPPAPMDAAGILHWIMVRQMPAAGTA